MKSGKALLIRTSSILLYLTFFLSVYLGLHVYLGNTTTVQDNREYTTTNNPEYFPTLVTIKGQAAPELRSLSALEYSGLSTKWQLYKKIETKQLPHEKTVRYEITKLTEKRLQAVITIAEENHQRLSTYTYEIEANKATPRTYRLTSSFGKNFSPLPFLVLLTGLLIYLSEHFILKRLYQRYS